MIFQRELALKIVRGEKTATRRQLSDNPRSPWYRKRCAYVPGQRFTINPGRGKLRIAEALCVDVYRAPLGAVQAEQAKQEGFGSTLAFREAWTRINGGLNLAELVWVVEFKLAGDPCEKCRGTLRELIGGEALGWYQDCTKCFKTGIEPSIEARLLIKELE